MDLNLEGTGTGQVGLQAAAFESGSEWCCSLDRNWNFIFVNQEFASLLQASPEDLTGRSVWDVFPEEVGRPSYQQCHQVMATGKPAHFESYFERLQIWIEAEVFPAPGGLTVYLQDVSAKVKIRQEFEMLSLVASKTTNGVVILDADSRIEWVNEGFTNLTGYTLAEVLHRDPGSLLQGPETDPATSRWLQEKFRQHLPFSCEILNYNKAGNKLWFSLDVTPVLNNLGQVTRYIAIQNDITFRKDAEEAQLKLTRDLYRQNSNLQQFTYIVSHNLRSPVANAMGLTDLLCRLDKNSDTFDLALDNLQTSMHNLDAILKDLNLILSIRDNKESTGQEKVDLRQVCQQAISSLQQPLAACQCQVSLQIPENTCVKGNKAYFYSIFYNLLSNAIKYRSPDRKLQICVESHASPGQPRSLTITDNGSGFDLEKAGDNLFKLYKRFHPGADGRGIGLFLVKAHMEAMGGRVEVKSQVKEGTCFTLCLQD
ncbi:MAG: sensor histidine kinase [Adhaeribacter sp.]